MNDRQLTFEERLFRALVAAYDAETLRQMIRFRLAENPDAIIPTSERMNTMAFELIKWAEQNDRMQDLVVAAANYVPTRTDLKSLLDELTSPDNNPGLSAISRAGSEWILVAGSGGLARRPTVVDEVSENVGAALASAGRSLVTCGWDGVDRIVGRSFAKRLQQSGKTLSRRLVQFMPAGQTPDFPGGTLESTNSDDEAWRRSIKRSQAVVLIGGLGGTYRTGELALQMGKPVFPLADTRGPDRLHADAYNFFFDTLRDWSRNPASTVVSPDQFRELANPAPGVVADLVSVLQSFFDKDR